MSDDLSQLAEELISTAARVIRWVPADGLTLSLASMRILARVFDNGSSRISDLATLERSSQPTITNHIQRLEALGLVERSVDPKDARVSRINLTDLGRQRLAEARHQLGANVQAPLTGLSQRDLKTLRQGLAVMRRLMNADSPKG